MPTYLLLLLKKKKKKEAKGVLISPLACFCRYENEAQD